MTPPDWHRLLRHQQRIGQQGLTVPFLIGALIRSRSADVSVDDGAKVFTLLMLIRDEMPDEEIVCISLCGRLNQPIATLSRAAHYFSADADLKFCAPNDSRHTLIVSPRYGKAGVSSLQDVADTLYTTCSTALANERFSYCPRTQSFQPFDSRDVQFIDQALSYNEDDDL